MLGGSPIRDKKDMYRMLAAGAFGNTTRQFFSVEEWEASPESGYPSWGVRTRVSGGPCRLYCPREEVRETALRPEFLAAGVNISVMVDAVTRVRLWADVYDSEVGLRVYGIEWPPRGGNWRELMPSAGRERAGLAAVCLLQHHLTPSSLADLQTLREWYPGHVYELSALESCLGTVPGRNAVIWEVRPADGSYERDTWRVGGAR